MMSERRLVEEQKLIFLFVDQVKLFRHRNSIFMQFLLCRSIKLNS